MNELDGDAPSRPESACRPRSRMALRDPLMVARLRAAGDAAQSPSRSVSAQGGVSLSQLYAIGDASALQQLQRETARHNASSGYVDETSPLTVAVQRSVRIGDNDYALDNPCNSSDHKPSQRMGAARWRPETGGWLSYLELDPLASGVFAHPDAAKGPAALATRRETPRRRPPSRGVESESHLSSTRVIQQVAARKAGAAAGLEGGGQRLQRLIDEEFPPVAAVRGWRQGLLGRCIASWEPGQRGAAQPKKTAAGQQPPDPDTTVPASFLSPDEEARMVAVASHELSPHRDGPSVPPVPPPSPDGEFLDFLCATADREAVRGDGGGWPETAAVAGALYTSRCGRLPEDPSCFVNARTQLDSLLPRSFGGRTPRWFRRHYFPFACAARGYDDPKNVHTFSVKRLTMFVAGLSRCVGSVGGRQPGVHITDSSDEEANETPAGRGNRIASGSCSPRSVSSSDDEERPLPEDRPAAPALRSMHTSDSLLHIIYHHDNRQRQATASAASGTYQSVSQPQRAGAGPVALGRAAHVEEELPITTVPPSKRRYGVWKDLLRRRRQKIISEERERRGKVVFTERDADGDPVAVPHRRAQPTYNEEQLFHEVPVCQETVESFVSVKDTVRRHQPDAASFVSLSRREVDDLQQEVLRGEIDEGVWHSYSEGQVSKLASRTGRRDELRAWNDTQMLIQRAVVPLARLASSHKEHFLPPPPRVSQRSSMQSNATAFASVVEARNYSPQRRRDHHHKSLDTVTATPIRVLPRDDMHELMAPPPPAVLVAATSDVPGSQGALRQRVTTSKTQERAALARRKRRLAPTSATAAEEVLRPTVTSVAIAGQRFTYSTALHHPSLTPNFGLTE